MPSGWSEDEVLPPVMSMEMSGYSRSFGIDVVFRGAYGFMPISFPRNIELRSQRLERQPIPLWLEDYEEGMAILMHIGIENRFGYLNRFFRKGEGRRKSDGLAGYLNAIPKSFRMSAIPKTS
jgi:hypothetical protein